MYISPTALISIIHKTFCTNFGSTSPPIEKAEELALTALPALAELL
jgi:hypothetical protein